MEKDERKAVAELLPLSEVDFLILLILVDGDCHGYGMVKEIRQRTGGKTSLLPGNLYAMLRRLEGQGLIEGLDRRAESDQDDRRRRYYRVTDRGRKAAAAEAARMKSLVRQAEARRLIGRTVQ